MPDLIAQGALPEQRWRRKVPLGQAIVVGRSAGRWSVPWDDRVSRTHVRLSFDDGQLSVTRIPESLNPVFYQGTARDQFELRCGEHFVIGSTAFSLVEQHLGATLDAPPPVTEKTISYEFLQELRFGDADRRIDALSKLPEILSAAVTEEEQSAKLVELLLASIPQANFVGIAEISTSSDEITTMPWERRDFQRDANLPSERLIRQALESQASVVHTWRRNSSDAEISFTQHDGADWAFCVPFASQEAWTRAVYVAGNFSNVGPQPTPNLLTEEVKFVDLAARTLGHLRGLRRFERETANLRQFISPVVIDTLVDQDPDLALAPREADVSVLFCDLRGFSRRTEQESDDLLGLLHRVSDALGVMTRQILAHGGVVGDFHGDSAMGFWGWPFAQEDTAARVCQAALAIRREFADAAIDRHHPLSDFRMGIGIASGRAVAGKIGTVDQVKVTVFGPVVNLASRLESMTKTLRASILLDDSTAAYVREHVPTTRARVRRIAHVRPYGLATPLEVSELLPPTSEFPELSDDAIAMYEQALDAFAGGDWERSFSLLHQVPATDRVKDFLTVFIAQNNRRPPSDWDGTIPLGREIQHGNDA
ncbi:MAG TPA: adenylate/guanylate cyclase domain-containing protein [Pirellulaceae bacterium]|nr:adenylate/guanylate cyclase domain-containing protein [Pirellulaceae bacterium]